MRCSSCDAALTPVFEGDCAPHITQQFNNALVLQVEGGYGMFTDNLDEEYPVFILCHECAHLFCKIFDPRKRLIDPDESHMREEGSVSDAHEGWDR